MIDTLPLPRIGDPIKAEHIAAISKALRKRTPLNSPSVKVCETANGYYLTAKSSVAASSFKGCWYPSRVNAELIKLTAGSISDGITTFTPAVTSITVSATALQYVYLVCSITPTIVDSFVTGGVITAASVQAFNMAQTTDNTTAYVLLCTWQSGVLISRYTFWSLQAEFCNAAYGTVLFRTWDT